MPNPEQTFIQYLATQGLKNTSQRKTIFQDIYAIHGHFEIEDFLSRFQKKHLGFSRATVYRTLQIMLSAGLITKITTPANKVYYEHTLGHRHHDHLICENCGKVIEVAHEGLENIQEQLCKQKNFKARRHMLQIFGICEECG